MIPICILDSLKPVSQLVSSRLFASFLAHTSHLGSNEVSTKIDTLEVAMKNKGGYTPGVSSYNSEPAMPTRPIRREE
ncbi:hypothetical protein ACHWQZ_G012976 [Mnemiopsis leidyi]